MEGSASGIIWDGNFCGWKCVHKQSKVHPAETQHARVLWTGQGSVKAKDCMCWCVCMPKSSQMKHKWRPQPITWNGWLVSTFIVNKKLFSLICLPLYVRGSYWSAVWKSNLWKGCKKSKKRTKRRKELTAVGGGLEEGRERCGGGQGPVSPLCWSSLFPMLLLQSGQGRGETCGVDRSRRRWLCWEFLLKTVSVFFFLWKVNWRKKNVSARLAGCAQYLKEITTYHQPLKYSAKIATQKGQRRRFILFIPMDFSCTDSSLQGTTLQSLRCL